MVALSGGVNAYGDHWYPIPVLAGAPFVAAPLGLDSLPSIVIYTTSIKYYRIPRQAVISLSLFDSGPYPGYAECPRLVNAIFDAQPAMLPVADFFAASMQRKVARVLPDGRRVLQNTRTSSVDFIFTFPRTPGHVP